MTDDRQRDLWRIRLVLLGLGLLAVLLLVLAYVYARAVF